jgi:hypothetical protein
MSSRVLLIVQSPIGIASLLQIYLNKISKHEITILCLGSKGLYQYLEKLDLKCNLLFIQPEAYASNKLSYIYRLARQRKLIKNFCIDWDEVYITSLYQDICAMMIANECITNNIKIYKVITELSSLEKYAKKNSLSAKIAEFFLHKAVIFFAGLDVKLINLNGKYIFSYKDHDAISSLNIEVERSVYKTFGVEVTGGSHRNILLFESLGEDGSHYRNYRERLQELIERLSRIGRVSIKPHPTYGISKFLENDIRCNYLDSSIPAAMINLEKFEMIVGVDSAALKEVSHHNVISVINSFEFSDNTIRDSIKKYLKNGTISEIKFILIEEIDHYLNCSDHNRVKNNV